MGKFANYSIIIGLLVLVSIIIFLVSMDSLEPLQYGITYNKLSKRIGTNVYESGRYLIGPFQSFIVYPARLITVEFSTHRKATVRIKLY